MSFLIAYNVNVKFEAMNKEIKNIIEATSMGKLEKESVLNELLNLHDVVGRSEQLVCGKCDEDGWIVRNEGDIISRRLCNCDKAK